MEVCVFTEGGDPNSDAYEQVSTINQVTTGQWTIYETDLSQYAGQKVRIGVHYMSFDAFFTQIDDFYVGNGQDEGTTIDVGYVQHYEVSLDGVQQGTTTQPQYTLRNVTAGDHTVGVRATYASGASQWVEHAFTMPALAIQGDANGDYIVDIADVNTAIDIMLGKTTGYNFAADANGDGQIDISDVNLIINIMLGK